MATKYPGWRNFPTLQFREIIAELEEAKEEAKNLMIIANTGLGKSNAIKAFMNNKASAKHTYVFTLGDSYNLMTLLSNILAVFGLTVHDWRNAKYKSLHTIASKLNEIADAGGRPLIILDEAENARMPTLKAIKELYDAIQGKCGIVLFGTMQLITQLNKKASGQSIPQLKRRFKAGTRYITPFRKEKDMKPFFNEYIPDEADIQDLLIELCDNYGELYDYLHNYLQHCTKKNKTVSAEGFRLYHKIPNR